MSICDDTCVFKIPENSSRVKGPQERIEVHQYFNLWYTKLQQNRVIQLMSDILHQTSLIDQLPTNNWIKKLRFSMINWVGVVFLFATPHPFNSPSFLSTFHQKTCFLSNTPYFHPPPSKNKQNARETPGKRDQGRDFHTRSTCFSWSGENSRKRSRNFPPPTHLDMSR